MEAMTPLDARQISPLMLAYIGDAVIELRVRRRILTHGCYRMNVVNQQVVAYVRASSQAAAYHMLEAITSEEDMAIAKRGRNAKARHTRKNANMTEYKLATGFEAIVGYYELTVQTEKLEQAMDCLYLVVEGTEGE
jgi:ribonuclease-3 family protein